MTLQRFLDACSDSRIGWWGLARFKPRPDQRFTLSAFTLIVGLSTSAAALIGLLFTVLLRSNPVMGGSWWPVQWCAAIGLSMGVFNTLVSATAWNRRAARLRSAGLVEPSPPPPTRWWQRWLIGPFYAGVVFLLTPIALTLAIDNALGTAAWNRTHAELVRRGTPLTREQLLTAPPADDQNFAMTPLLRAAWDYEIAVTNGRSELKWKDPNGRQRIQSIYLPQPIRLGESKKSSRNETNSSRLNLDSYARGMRAKPFPESTPISPELLKRYGLTNLPSATGKSSGPTNPPLSWEQIQALQIEDPAEEILGFLRRYEPELSEISTASRRPRSRFNIPIEIGFMPHLGHLKNFSTLYRVRAAARLAKGDASGAFADTLTLFRLAEAVSEEPTVMTVLIRIAQSAIAVNSVFEGLAAHAWSDAQIVELQGILRADEFRESLRFAFQGERIYGHRMYDQMLGSSAQQDALWVQDQTESTMNPAMDPFPRLPAVAPRGMFRRNQIHHHRLFDRIDAEIQSPNWPTSLTNLVSTEDFLRSMGLRPATPHSILPAMLAPAFANVQGKAARQVVTARLADTACALERHRLKHGVFPEQLAALVPDFLPTIPVDPMNRQPLHYQRTDDGWFKLWSVGLNGRDDGGTMKRGEENNTHGDWVWPTPIPSTGPRLF
ncbi:MAG: hypothetical protein JNK85_26155 [Verrucomicrobiales bacterium]|nr:hypothetical protein [Verrucomicrobiales bacterium]